MASTPLSDHLLQNVKDRKKASWARRYIRAIQSGELPENTELEEAKTILEEIFESICTSKFERESLMTLLTNDGSRESLAELLSKVVKRFEAKATAGIGIMAKRPTHHKYGPLSVALSNDAAVSHKAECEPETVFRIDTEGLNYMWNYLKPAPISAKAKEDSKWELRLNDRHWYDDRDSRYHFILVKTYLNVRDDEVTNESFHGNYQWLPLMYNGDVYDKYKLQLELPSFGNTDKVTGEGSDLTIIYRRDIDKREQLHYVEHWFGRVNTSEMLNLDQYFPPFMIEGEEDELDDDAIGLIVENSLNKLSKGAKAGMDVHEAYLPDERVKQFADGFEEGGD
jgi:hypothetical protein